MGAHAKFEHVLSHTCNLTHRLMFISQERSPQVRIHRTLGDCHLAKVAHAAPSNPKYSHARARLWRQTLRGGHSSGFPSSTKQPNPHAGSPGVAGASGVSTGPQRGQMELTVQSCSMSGLPTLSVYSGCGSNMDAAILLLLLLTEAKARWY